MWNETIDLTWTTAFIAAIGVIVLALKVWDLIPGKESCHNPSSHDETIETDKTREVARQKKTPDSHKGDSGEDEAGDVR